MSEDLQVVKSEKQMAVNLDKLAFEIRCYQAHAQNTALMCMMEIGKRLIQAKEALPMGDWTAWRREKVHYSERKTQILMSLYRNYGDSQGKLFGESISADKLDKLGFSQAVALLAIKDEDERAEFVNNNPVEDMSVRELEQAIKEKNELKAARDKLEAELAKAKQEMTVTENRIADLESAMQDRTVQDGEAEELKRELEKQKQAVKDAEERALNLQETIRLESREKAKLIGKLGKLEEALDEMEEKLAEPVEPAVVYEVPEETKKELAELRAELEKAKAKPGASEEKVRFVMYFEALNKAFEGMLKVIAEIEDAEKKAQYRGKLLNIVGLMKSKI